MRSARRASVQSAGCEALRAEQTVDTPHPHVVAGREAFGNNKVLCRSAYHYKLDVIQKDCLRVEKQFF